MKVGDLSGSNSIDLRARGVHIVIARQSLATKFSKETCEKRKSKICLAKAAPAERSASAEVGRFASLASSFHYVHDLLS